MSRGLKNNFSIPTFPTGFRHKSLDEFSDSASDRIVLYNMSRKTINRQKVDMEEKSALSLNFFQHDIFRPVHNFDD